MRHCVLLYLEWLKVLLERTVIVLRCVVLCCFVYPIYNISSEDKELTSVSQSSGRLACN